MALRSAIGLAQAGEFGFVLLTLADGAHLLGDATMQVTLAAMLLSMLAAPFLIQYGEAIARRFSAAEWTNRAMQMHQIAIQSMGSNEHIIICGYGRSGHTLASFLEEENCVSSRWTWIRAACAKPSRPRKAWYTATPPSARC